MGEASVLRRWGRHLAIVVAYACAYALLRGVSVSHWNLTAGLRIACLLLLPYRYWPALIVGELIPVGEHAWYCRDDFGWRWAALAATPPILPLSLAVAWARRQARLMLGAREINVAMLLGVIFAGAALTAAGDAATLAAVRLPPDGTTLSVTKQIVFGYFLGNYLGAIAIAPSAIAIYLAFPRAGQPLRSASRWYGLLARDCLIGVLLPLFVLVGLVLSSQGDNMQVFRIAMFLPVAWLTSRYGWQGAAIGGTLAGFAVTMTSTMVRDPGVIQAQALIAFAVTTLLLLGSRIAHQAHNAASNQLDTLRGFQLAQQGLYLEELRMRQAADALEHIGQSIRENHNRLLDRLRHVLPANEEHIYSRHVVLAQHEMHRLANALHPRGWRERGVPATLREGPFAQAIHLAGATYQCDLSGRGLSQLAPDVHLTLYRLACEVLVYVLSRTPMQHVHLQLRGGYTGGRRWVVMRVTGEPVTEDADRRSEPFPREGEASWKQAMTLLGASGLGMGAIRDRAHIYGGDVHVRDLQPGLSVTLLLHDSLRSVSIHQGASA
ncbi:MASE1 domain-containing protein [Dyella amyloliquefaciens]|uniref:MASE1 domain-containing protein n=1 Tax=Dyella amyloliquefaciens TaxID=1770545 RepID=UPI00102E8F4A|nr:MASE1 domain-containing protein [Dyella amyloliquefaciens]